MKQEQINQIKYHLIFLLTTASKVYKTKIGLLKLKHIFEKPIKGKKQYNEATFIIKQN